MHKIVSSNPRSLWTAALLALLAALFVGMAALMIPQNAEAADPWRAEVDARIAEAPEDEMLRVIISFKRQGLDEVEAASPTPEGRAEFVEGLQDVAESSQVRVLGLLEAAKDRGEAANIEPFFIVNAVSAELRPSVVEELAGLDEVESIILDETIEAVVEPEEPAAPVGLMGLQSRSAGRHIPWNLSSIGMTESLLSQATGSGVVVGIIDSGVDASHPAIHASWRGNVSGEEAVSWYDPVGGSKLPVDSTGHGTHVAGTVLGVSEQEGAVLGIAPEATWIAARVFDEEGETKNTDLIKAGEWMLAPKDADGVPHPEKAPDIVNNSWGGNSSDEFYRDILKAWRKAGILPVFSAGNVGVSNPGGEGSIGTPASYPEAFAVGALRSDDHVAKFSLRGPSRYADASKPDVSAPGVNILSSIPGGGYALRTGTSMAGPHVTGVAALVLSVNPSLTPDQVEDILRRSATPLTDEEYTNSPNHGYGAGKINASLAVSMARAQQDGGGDGTASVSGVVYVPGEDEDAPAISHTPIKTIYSVSATLVEAQVEDLVGVASVTLQVAPAGSEEWISKPMSLVKGTKKSGGYQASITPKELDPAGMRYRIVAVDASGKESSVEANDVLVKGGIGIGYHEDFESGTDGYEFGGKTPMWAWGEPASSLNPAHSGSKVVGIGLAGEGYKGLKDSVLLTPPIDLSNESRKAAFTFEHWYDLDNGEGAFFDTAEVWVGEITDEETDETDFKLARSYKYRQGDWTREYVDLSAWSGKKIRVMFGMRYHGWSKRETAGWFIDDVAIEQATADKPAAPSKGLGIRNDASGRSVISFSPVANEAVSGYALYRSHDGGDFERVQSIDVKDAGTYSVSFNDYPTPQMGSYAYYVTTLSGELESDPSERLERVFSEGTEFKRFDFEEDEQGWTSEPDAKGSVWTRGVPVAEDYPGGKKPGKGQDRGKNPNSPNVFATVLDDFRAPQATYSLTSPALDLSGHDRVVMYYQNWFNTQGRKGSDEWGSYDNDTGRIEVSSNGGASWETIFKLDQESISDSKRRTPNFWYLDHVEVPAAYLVDDVQVRFVLEAGTDSYDSQCGGWYLDDVSFVDPGQGRSAGTHEAELAGAVSDADVDAGEAEADAAVLGAESDGAESDGAAAEDAIANAEADEPDGDADEGLEPFELSNLASSPLMPIEAMDREPAAMPGWVPAEATVSVVGQGSSVATEVGSGAYSLKVPSGKLSLRVSKPGYLSQEVELDLAEGFEATQDFHLVAATPQDMLVSVADQKGMPLPEAVVTVYGEAAGPAMLELKGASVTAGQLMPGTYLVRAQAPGMKTAEKSVTVPEEGSVDPVAFALTPVKPIENSAAELAHDDGTPDSALSTLAEGATAGVKFEAPANSQVDKLFFRCVKGTGGDSTGAEFDYAIYDADDEDGLPGKLLAGPYTGKVASEGDWTEIVLDRPVQVNGSFYVSFTQRGDGEGRAVLGVDESTPGLGHSYRLFNGAWNDPDEKGSFMIRAMISSFEATGGAGPQPQPDSGTEPDPGAQPQPQPEPDSGNQPEPGTQPGSTAHPDGRGGASSDALKGSGGGSATQRSQASDAAAKGSLPRTGDDLALGGMAATAAGAAIVMIVAARRKRSA